MFTGPYFFCQVKIQTTCCPEPDGRIKPLAGPALPGSLPDGDLAGLATDLGYEDSGVTSLTGLNFKPVS